MRAIPYLAFFPKTAPPSGTPVIIALHGLGRSKSDWLLFAATACRTGHALIAIDLFQHGDRQDKIDPKEGSFAGKLDTALLKGGIAFPDPFINPTFLARTRDKLRQSMVDTLALIRILGAADGLLPIDFDGDGQPDPAYGPIRLLAMSLGAMVALPVAAVSPEVDRVVLTSPGAHISQIVNDIAAIAKQLDPLIYMTANADQFGLLHDSPRFMLPDGPEREVFTRVSETIFAPADPVT
jgi:pimeloyl-ACP methyl ester carboxylesterase